MTVRELRRFRPKTRTVGLGRSMNGLCWIAIAVAGCIVVLGLACFSPAARADAACTDSWTGSAGDSAWSTPANWSTGAVPTAQDVVCLPAATAVEVDGDAVAASLEAEGASVTVAGGSLVLSASSATSTISSLTLSGGELSVAGRLAVDQAFQWTGGTLSGAGTTELTSAATSTITPTSQDDPVVLDAQKLENEGSLTFECINATDPSGSAALISGQDAAEIVNDGQMVLDTPNPSWQAPYVGGCEFQRADNSTDVLDNEGTLTAANYDDTNIGWAIANGPAATIDVPTDSSELTFFAGDAAPLSGTWEGDGYVDMVAGGNYAFTADSQVEVQGELDTWEAPGYSGSGWESYVQWLAGNTAEATISTGAVDWPNSELGSETNITVGDGSGEASVGSLYADGRQYGASVAYATATLQEPNTYSGTDPSIAINAGATEFGTLYLSGQVMAPTAVVGAFGGLVSITSENDTIGELQGQTGVLSQTGTLTVSEQMLGAEGATLTGGGTTVLAAGNENQSSLNGWLLDGQTVINDQTMSLAWGLPVKGAHGAQVINNGTLIGGGNPDVYSGPIPGTPTGVDPGAMLATSQGAAPVLVNNGSMVKFDCTEGDGSSCGPLHAMSIIDWNFENAGSIDQPAFSFIVPGANGFGGNPAAPNSPTVGCGDPVNCATGDQEEQQTDLSLSGLGGPLSLTRTYSSQLAATQPTPGMFGYGWTSAFDAHLNLSPGQSTATVQNSNGSTVRFSLDKNGSFSPEASADASDVDATLSQNSDGSYSYALPDGRSLEFDADGNLVSDRDVAGHITSLSYSPSGQLTTVTAPSGRQLSFTYNASGLVATAADSAGETVSYSYDYNDNLTEVIYSGDPSPRWQFGYDYQHQMTSMTNGDSQTTQIAYEGLQVASQTDPMGRVRTWAYSPGETVVVSPAGNITQNLFNSDDEPIAITHGLGSSAQSTETFAYDSQGNLDAVTDGNDHTTTYGYNSAGDRTSATNALNQTTSWTYNASHEVTSNTLPSGLETTYAYNSQNLPTSTTVTGTDGHSETTTATYNDSGELTGTTDAMGRQTTYEYDASGDVSSITDPAGETTTLAYDGDGRVVSSVSPAGNAAGGDPLAHTTSYSYDPLGDLTTTTDPNGHQTTSAYDGNQNLISTTDPDGATTSYSYDSDGELTGTTLPDNSTDTATYDPDGNLASQTNGNSDTTRYTWTPLDQLASQTDPLNRTSTYNYDAAGNLISITDTQGRTTTDTYSANNQLSSVSYSDGTTPNIAYTYTADGEPATMTDGSGTSTDHYDSLDRLSSTTNGAGQTVSYGYNADDNPTTIVYPNGHTVNNSYDNDQRVSSVTDWNNHTTTFAYTADSTLQSITYPAGTSDQDSFSYDNADQLSGIQIARGTTTLASLSYQLDPAGLITAQTQTGLPGDASTSYSYTANEQLQSAGPLNYGYDHGDNLTTLDSQGNLQYDAASELTSSPAANYGYDQLGDRTSSTPADGSTATRYGYNQTQELTSLTPPNEAATSDSYDGNGELTSSSAAGTTNTYTWANLGHTPLLLSDGHTNYIYGPQGVPIEQIAGDGSTSYLHHDQIGSTRVITDSSGQTVATDTYTPYGSLSGSTGSAHSDIGYAGQYTDPATGLEYDQARWYDAHTGQFLSVDPLENLTGKPYSYVGGDPLSFTDPSGEIPDPFTPLAAGIGAVVGGLSGAIGYGAGVVSGNQSFSVSGLVGATAGGAAGGAVTGGCIEATDALGLATCGAAGGFASTSVNNLITGQSEVSGLAANVLLGAAGNVIAGSAVTTHGMLPQKLSNLWNPSINAQRLYAQSGIAGLLGAFGTAVQATPAYGRELNAAGRCVVY